MQTAEIIDGLRPVLENGIDNPTLRAAVQAAIERLTPVPITEAALGAEGFEHGQKRRIYNPDNDVTTTIFFDVDCGELWMDVSAGGTMLPGITTMQRLREVIAAIEGDDVSSNESEEQR